MKLPVPFIWRIIGDFFNREVFYDDDKRPIDSLWQVMADNSAELLEYIDQYRKEKNVFEVEPFVPWGTFGSIARPVEQSLDIGGVLIGGREEDFWNWMLYTTSNEVPPSSGYIELFSSSEEETPCASVQYDTVSVDNLYSGGSVIRTSGSQFSSGIPWDDTENASYVFGDETLLDGSGRWSGTGSRPPTAETTGLEFDLDWVNWGILHDKYYFDGAQNWRQVWRMEVKNWDVTQLERTMSLTSFGDTGNPFEIRLTSTGGSVTVDTGIYAVTRSEVLTFSGFTVTRGAGSFIGDGFMSGMSVSVIGTTSNDGTYTVDTVTASTLTLIEAVAAEVSTPDAQVRSDLDVTTGNTTGWQEKLELATPEAPVFIEFVLNYDSVSASLTSSVWLDGERARQVTAYKVPPGRRNHAVDIFNQYQNLLVEIGYVVGEGALWNSVENIDFSSSVGSTFTYKYEIDEPLVGSLNIRSEPWDLAPSADVVSQTVNEISLVLSEDWAGYAPEYVRVFNSAGQWIVGELKSQNELDIVYTIVLQCDLGVEVSGEVQLHPWYLSSSEFTWDEAGVVGTRQPIPYTDRTSWFISAQASEMDLYDRYAKILGIGRRVDSQEYLDIIRGYQYGLLTPPTVEFTERAVGVMSGLPYTVESGTLTSVTRFRDELGAPLYDEVVVGGRAYKIDTIWSDNDMILPLGTIIPFMSPIVNGVKVYHYLNDIEKIQAVIDDVWSTWGTFLVQIPASAGVDEFSIKEIISMLKRKKDKDTDFILEYITDVSENFGSGEVDYLKDPDVHEVYAHTIEDMMFDDDGTVYQNSMNFQWRAPEDAEPYEEFIVNNGIFSSLVHGWPMQELSGTTASDVKDVAVGTHDGGVVVAQDGYAGRFDYAVDYSFNTTTETTVADADYALATGASDDFTIIAWVKSSAVGNTGPFGKRDTGAGGAGYDATISAAGVMFANVTDGVGSVLIDSTTGTINDGTWHMLVMRVDRTEQELQCWVFDDDGTIHTGAAGDITALGSFDSSGIDLLIGRSHINDSVVGVVAHVYAFQEALTDQHMNLLWRARGGLFSEEYQTSRVSTLDEVSMLDTFLNLDKGNLVLNDVRYGWKGTEMGPAPSRPTAGYIYRDAGVFLKRELNQTERGSGFSKNPIRFTKPNTYQEYFYRPYELCTLFTAASPEFSSRDGGGTLYTYPTPSWEDRSFGGLTGVLLRATWLQNTNWVVMVGSNGAVFTSSNYGHTWTDRTVATLESFLGVSATSSVVWMVGSNDLVYTQATEGSALVSDTINGGYDHQDIFFLDDDIGWTCSDDGVDAYSIKTIDGGATWGTPVLVASGELAQCVHFISATHGWYVTGNGLYKTDDGGATWDLIVAGAYEGVMMISDDIVIAVGTSGLGTITTNASDVTPITSAITFPGTAGDLYDIWYDGFEIFVVGGTAATVGQIYRSQDNGITWSLTTEGTEPFYGVFGIRPFERMIVREEEVFRWL